LLEVRDGKLLTLWIFRFADAVTQQHDAAARWEVERDGVKAGLRQHAHRHVSLFDLADAAVRVDQERGNMAAVDQLG
jgi:hypothetical protein